MRIPETATGEFEPGDPVTGKPGSRLSSAYMNSQLREILNILRAAGITQNNDDDGQLLAAIRKLITTATAVVVPPTLGGTGLDYIQPGNYLVGNGKDAMTSRTPAQVFNDLGIAQYVAKQRRVVVLSIESPVDANTLTLPETLYKWSNFGGSWTNFPNVQAPGYLQTRQLNTNTLCQELTLVAAASKALCYFRVAPVGGTWEPWRVASAFSTASQLPTWDAGDVYVDGLGWHRWNGAAYAVNDALRKCFFDELPTTDVGPIYVMDFGEIWSWVDTTGATVIPFKGYRSPDCGKICFSLSEYPSEGWLRANGSIALKTRYAGLYSMLGARFGETATHFTLPDLRGEFLRAWDNARGVDPGRGLGTTQADALQGHWHQMYINPLDYGTRDHNGVGDAASYAANTALAGRVRETITDGVNGEPRIANETRPRNFAALACIKI